MQLWSVGHSTHSLEAFIALLAAEGIELIADIRRFPGSRRHPHFSIEVFERSLSERGIGYRHLPRLGGRRRPAESSPNGGWQNASFRGYADYALTAEFAEGLAELRGLAAVARTAMMCSEALWWRCHRRLVADRLVAGGDVVWHLDADGRSSPHQLTPFASVGADGLVTYPPGAPPQRAARSRVGAGSEE
jgi:uncharacterized protein (DUF488 family)